MSFHSVARTHVGRRRRLNEDAFLSRPDLGLWAVADGMGGHDRGEVASAMATQRLADCPADLDLDGRGLWARLELQKVNQQLIALAQAGEEQKPIGSTVVVLAAEATRFLCLWAGDSRAYRVRQGELVQLTHDHSLVQRLVDAGVLDPLDADNHPDSHVITRAVGIDAALQLDVTQGEVLAGDRFLLASDGLTRLVSRKEILEGLRSNDLEAAADRWIEMALARGAPDNVTLVAVRAA